MIALHPFAPCPWLESLVVKLDRQADGLALSFQLRGDLKRLRLPPRAQRKPADGLWRHTSFEVCVRRDDAPGDREFNFSPSGAWAAYRFSGYREGMAAFDLPDPDIVVQASSAKLQLRAYLADLPTGPVSLALSAVIEDTEGGLNYWALAHPGEQPDFHHPAAFTLELP